MTRFRSTAASFLVLCLALLGGCAKTTDTGQTALADNTGVSPTQQRLLAEKMAKKRAKGPKPFDKPKESLLFFLAQRLPAGEKAIDYTWYDEALKKAAALDLYATRTGRLVPAKARQSFKDSREALLSGWSYHGPGNIGGRTRAMLIHPTTPDTMYVGGVAGGVFKTTNGGASWTPMTDLALSNLAVNAMAMDRNDANVIYAGTGEGFFSVDAMRGAGIFKTSNGGTTWTHLTATNTADFYYVNKIVMSPTAANRLYAATRTGIHRSNDGGTGWTKVHDATDLNGCLDLAVRTDKTTDVVFASCGMSSYNNTPVQAKIYRNTDAGGIGTWTQVYTETDMSRTSLALAPSNQDVIYALATSKATGTFKDGLLAVLRSIDGGANWTARVRNDSSTKLDTLLLTNPYSAYGDCKPGGTPDFANQGWYDNVIAVDPIDDNIVWAGGIDLFRSDNGGTSWGLASYWWAETNQSSYNHADHHVILFHPSYNGGANKIMFTGNDGGVYKTTNARATVSTDACNVTSTSVAWTSLNNSLGITQFYYGAVYPDGKTYFGGTQDNGTIRGTDALGANQWASIYGGDGGAVAVKPNDTNILYCEYTNLSIKKSTDGGASFADAVNGITEASKNFLFIAPYVMDPSEPDRLWTGATLLWRTNDAAGNWTQASSAIPENNTISALSVSPLDSKRVAAGTDSGHVLTSTDALAAGSGTAWSAVEVVAGGYISSVAHDPRSADTLYATCSTFGKGHVWKSTDYGANWTNISGGGSGALPDVPAHTILVDPGNSSRLYVGTDIGVFVTLNGGQSWAVENTGFANAISQNLVRNASTGKVFVFTHGRGVWSVPLANPSVGPATDLLLLLNN